MSYPNMTIAHTHGGFLICAHIVRDAGDGIPWPYRHEQIATSLDDLLALVRSVFEQCKVEH